MKPQLLSLGGIEASEPRRTGAVIEDRRSPGQIAHLGVTEPLLECGSVPESLPGCDGIIRWRRTCRSECDVIGGVGERVPLRRIQLPDHVPPRCDDPGRHRLHLHKRIAVLQATLDVMGASRRNPVLGLIPAELGNRIVDHRLADDRIADKGRLPGSGADDSSPLADAGVEAARRTGLDGLLTPQDLAGVVLHLVIDIDPFVVGLHLHHLFTLSTIHGCTTIRSKTASATPRAAPLATSRIISLDPWPIAAPSPGSLRC